MELEKKKKACFKFVSTQPEPVGVSEPAHVKSFKRHEYVKVLTFQGDRAWVRQHRQREQEHKVHHRQAIVAERRS